MGEIVERSEQGIACVLRSPRALDAAVLAEGHAHVRAVRHALERTAEAGAAQSDLASVLGQPLLVVVPSASLREHLSSVLCALGATLGLRVLTLEALAQEVLRRAGEVCAESPLHGVAVRRLASDEPTLSAPLDPYDDGYQVVAGAVDDLLDAGLEPAHGEFLLECIESLEAGIPAARVAAVTRVAVAMAERQSGRLCHRAERLARARRAIEADPELVLPIRRLLLVGFQDATGVQTDLIETLLRTRPSRILFEHPYDPVLGGAAGDFGRFGERLRERVAGFGELAVEEEEPSFGIEVVRAPDRESEVRDLAATLRSLLDQGETAERMGVVARDLGTYKAALRRHFDRMGVPFSGCGEPGLGGPARMRLDAMQELLKARERCPTDRWLDALAALPATGGEPVQALSLQSTSQLRRSLHRRGCVQLRDLAELPPGTRGLGEAVRAAAALLHSFDSLSSTRTLGQHAVALRTFASDDLGWGLGAEGASALSEVDALLASPAFEAACDETLRFDEFIAVLRRGLATAARGRLGGRGGGVQVLSVTEARSRSFDVLFVMGLNRGVFPRSVHDDPFLPDVLRARLRDVLPEMPVKAEGHDEERFLLTQLLSAAPRVVLSCARNDEEGRPLAASPLLERLVGAGAPLSKRDAEPLHAELSRGAVRPAFEHALLAGLRGGHSVQGPLLRWALGVEEPGPLAEARMRVVREFDEYGKPGGEIGPYFGFVGRRTGLVSPSVTHAEQILRCPWSAFLKRELGLGPAPDALDGLPRVDNEFMLLGNVVHGALDRLVKAQLPAADSPVDAEATRVVWPPTEEVSRHVIEAAQTELERAEIALPGYARVLALRAAPFLDVARDVDWSEGAVDVVGAEHGGQAVLSIGSGETRTLRFRADRVDRIPGGLRISDYKTGKTKINKKDDGNTLLETAAERRLLQAAVYAASASGVEGRYLFLKPADPGRREGSVVLPEQGLPETLEKALAALFGAYEEGALFPRLRLAREDKETSECRRCDVKEACLRGDSGARGRLARFMEDRDPEQGSLAMKSATALWQLEGK